MHQSLLLGDFSRLDLVRLLEIRMMFLTNIFQTDENVFRKRLKKYLPIELGARTTCFLSTAMLLPNEFKDFKFTIDIADLSLSYFDSPIVYVS